MSQGSNDAALSTGWQQEAVGRVLLCRGKKLRVVSYDEVNEVFTIEGRDKDTWPLPAAEAAEEWA